MARMLTNEERAYDQDTQTQLCPDCEERKAWSEFHKGGNRNGLQPYCKPCVSRRSKDSKAKLVVQEPKAPAPPGFEPSQVFAQMFSLSQGDTEQRPNIDPQLAQMLIGAQLELFSRILERS